MDLISKCYDKHLLTPPTNTVHYEEQMQVLSILHQKSPLFLIGKE